MILMIFLFYLGFSEETISSLGIGLAIAHRLADDGFSVAINDIESKSDALEEAVELLRFKGRKALAIVGDVSQEQDVQNMVDRTVEELGGLDVMVANAGISPTCPLAESK
jgi:NAD(P)-dependent dehydrogenase (short-subunit alcohol dehydrogenase family)